MITVRDNRTGIVGYGEDRDSALKAMMFNAAKYNMDDYYKKRHNELHPWLPLPNILHINGVGALEYEDGVLKNLSTGLSVNLPVRPYSHYVYIFPLLGNISFNDFTVTISRELDDFLHVISSDFGLLRDFPYIRPGSLTNAVSVHTAQTFSIVMKSDNSVCLLGRDLPTIECDVIGDVECTIAYLMSYTGILYDKNVEMRRNIKLAYQ